MLVRKFVSPSYTAVIEWLPTLRLESLNVAVSEPFNVPVPRVVVPSSKVTVPVGMPEPGALASTVAVKVTDWPNTEGVTEEITVDVVES